jgi:hypothetical protein
MSENKRFSIFSNDSNLNQLILSNNKSNVSDMSRLVEQVRNKLGGNKSVKVIRILKSVISDINEFVSKNPEIIKVNDKLNEAIDVLIREEDYIDDSFEGGESEKSESVTEGLDLIKSYSNNYSNEMKTNNLLRLAKSNSKFTQKGFSLKKIKDLKLESIKEDEETKRVKKPTIKRFSDAIKMSDKLSKLFGFDCNIFEIEDSLKQKTLPTVSSKIFSHLNYFEIDLIREKVFYAFAEELAAGYSRTVVYHNDIHAIDVFQTVFNFTHISDIDEVSIFKLI